MLFDTSPKIYLTFEWICKYQNIHWRVTASGF